MFLKSHFILVSPDKTPKKRVILLIVWMEMQLLSWFNF